MRSQEYHCRFWPEIMKMSTIVAIISNNLARHLLTGSQHVLRFWSPGAKNVIHQMQHFFVKKKRIREFLLFRVHAPGKDCIPARRARPTLTKLEGSSNTYTWTHVPPETFVHCCLSDGMPDFHSKDRGKVKADHHVKTVKSVIVGKSKRWRAGLHPVLWYSSWRKTVDHTAMLSVLSQARVHHPQVSDSIIKV